MIQYVSLFIYLFSINQASITTTRTALLYCMATSPYTVCHNNESEMLQYASIDFIVFDIFAQSNYK